MKKLLLTIIFLQSFHVLQAQTPTLFWVKNTSGPSDEVGNSVAVDGEGNVYTTGTYKGTVDFDPGTAVLNLTSNGGQDAFITKFDISGNLVWAKSVGGTTNDNGNAIGVDASGNVFVVGNFTGTADFDPNSGTTNLTSAGYTDLFILKLTPSGDLGFAKKIGGVGYDNIYSLAVDDLGNFYATGYFTTTVDFDPNAGVVNLSSAVDSRDVFITKFDGSGNLAWAKKIGGNQEDVGMSLAIGKQGNVYTTGYFSGTVDIDPNTAVLNITSAGAEDFFVINLDASGTLVWAKKFGGASSDFGNGIGVDSDGNSYVTGNFNGLVDFDPSPGNQYLTTAPIGVFILKLDASGNYVLAKSFDGDGLGNFAMTVDGSGNIYTTGFFYETIDFDPSANTHNLTADHADVYISKLDNSGNFLFAIKIGGSGDDYGHALTTDASGNLYAAGRFQSTVDFDPNAGVNSLTSAGYYDMFVVKLGQCTLNATANAVGSTITAQSNTTGVTYQWADCANGYTWIAGATENTYTPVTSGDYSVIVNKDGCIDTSSCVGITISIPTGTVASAYDLVSVYPNPSADIIKINSKVSFNNATISVYGSNGVLMMQYVQQYGESFQIDLSSLSKGVYVLDITDDAVSIKSKVIKQ